KRKNSGLGCDMGVLTSNEPNCTIRVWTLFTFCIVFATPSTEGSGQFRVHPEHGMNSIIPSTGSCRVTLVNVYGATIACEAPRHDQSEARNARRGSSAWNRCHVPSIGASFS